MFDQLFNNVFTGTTINPASMFGAIGVALVLGLILAKVYQYKNLQQVLYDDFGYATDFDCYCHFFSKW